MMEALACHPLGTFKKYPRQGILLRGSRYDQGPNAALTKEAGARRMSFPVPRYTQTYCVA